MNTPEKCPKCGAELLSRSFGEVTFYCGSRNSHPPQDSVWLQESAVCIRNQRDQLATKLSAIESDFSKCSDKMKRFRSRWLAAHQELRKANDYIELLESEKSC